MRGDLVGQGQAALAAANEGVQLAGMQVVNLVMKSRELGAMEVAPVADDQVVVK